MYATNFSVVSSIASLQRLGPDPQSPEAASVKVPPSNQRGFNSTRKLTTRKDSSVHAAAIRNKIINVVSTLCRGTMMTSDLRKLSVFWVL